MKNLISLLLILWIQGSPESLLDRYRRLDIAPNQDGPFNEAYKEKLAIEGELIRARKPEPLRAALKDNQAPVRAFAARALGILGDRPSIDALSALAQGDPVGLVREYAVLSLGWLKAGEEALRAAKSDRSTFVKFVAEVAEAQRTSAVDYAAELRAEYDIAVGREEMDRARVGKTAPDFSAVDTERKPFKLSEAVGKGIVVLDFLIADY